MGKEKLKTFIYEAQRRDKDKPGPAAYKPKESWVMPCTSFKGSAKASYISEIARKKRN
jgi:hypothetical protein